jgi:lysine-N-methylase
LRSLEFIKLLDQATFDKIQGARMQELCELLAMDIEARVGITTSAEPIVSKLGKTHFLLFVGQYVKKENWQTAAAGWGYRWKSMLAMWKISSNKGDLPEINPEFRSVPFAAIEEPFQGLPKESVELLERYYRIKVQSLHFTGPAFYGMNLVDGYTALLLVYPIVVYLARWKAAAEGRKTLRPDDVELALRTVDHHHGYSSALDGILVRNRFRYLLKYDLASLISHYSY